MSDYVRGLRAAVGHEPVLQVPSVSVAVRDDEGRVLLARHREGGTWLLPGGAVEPGETPADAALRETWEETGLLVRLTRLVGVFGGADFVVEYGNGDRTSYVMTVFEARAVSGHLRADGTELLEARFVAADEWAGLPCARWAPAVLRALCEGGPAAFTPAAWTPSGR
ncbi:MAG TPA: NUDIX domain-containing protein [Vicinamibacteria bacterium]|nr:NUDIX domain-containing protein [Vicinamibacteria bacterium]